MRLAAIAVATREQLSDLQEELGSSVTLLADPGAATVSAFGLLDPDPFPPVTMSRSATLLLDTRGRVVRWWLSDSYRRRPDPAALLATLR